VGRAARAGDADDRAHAQPGDDEPRRTAGADERNAARLVVEQIGDTDRLRKARVHPLAVLVAMKSYEQGYSDRSGQTWAPVQQVVDALDAAFYEAFGNVEATNKRTMLALDVSGSMSFTQIAGMPGITPRVGSAAMALVTAATEPQHMFTAFTTRLVS
jgi:60 kDa SS-A/Ro ribonucleoprotein